MLSICGTDFIADWAYEERISAHAQPAVKCEQFLYVQSMLSICGTNFIAHCVYAERILSHADHAWKCFKVEYLVRIEYDFQKSRVTSPWDHMVSVSAKKVKTKISCLCTFNPVFMNSLLEVRTDTQLFQYGFKSGSSTLSHCGSKRRFS